MSEEKHESGGFVINDRRGEKKEPRVDPVIIEATPEPAEGSTKAWKDVCYIIVIMQTPNGLMVAGRAVGLREDDQTFVADWIFPQTAWPEKLDWTEFSKKRLDTFLGCGCKSGQPCSNHKRLLPQWGQQDVDRLNLAAGGAMPAALEFYIRAEQARAQNRIVSPA